MQEPCYCFESRASLEDGSAYIFRLEMLQPNGAWVQSDEVERSFAWENPEDKPYFDELIADPSKFQAEE